jgi:hypothetical protein
VSGTWNYRICKESTKHGVKYEVHEVYYDENNQIRGFSKDAIAPFGETPEEVADDLAKMVASFSKGVLDLDTLESGPPLPR